MKALTLAGALIVVAIIRTTATAPAPTTEERTMDLGNFSVSLAVKDIEASRSF